MWTGTQTIGTVLGGVRKPEMVVEGKLQALFLRSLFLRSLFLRSLFLRSLVLRSLFLRSLFLRSLVLESFALRSLFLRSLFLRSLFLRSFALRSLFLRSLFRLVEYAAAGASIIFIACGAVMLSECFYIYKLRNFIQNKWRTVLTVI